MTGSRKRLKTGFSTGTAAAAAAAAALERLLGGPGPSGVAVRLPDGTDLAVAVAETWVKEGLEAGASVVKDAGDDPDMTHGAVIQARVSWLTEGNGDAIQIEGGRGVGRVTRPGLPVAVGEPAINPVPRAMIRENLMRRRAELADHDHPGRLRVVIEVPDGLRLAVKTLNPRLGIVDGISILGTTGLVRPFSHEAYTATIQSALDVAKAVGQGEVVLTTGGRSEKRAMALRPDLAETAFIQIADYFGFTLDQINRRGFEAVGLVSYFGKAVKQAQGLECTHAHRAPMDLGALADWLEADGGPAPLTRAVREANTARHALEILREREALHFSASVGRRLLSTARDRLGSDIRVWAVILDETGAVLFEEQGRSGKCSIPSIS